MADDQKDGMPTIKGGDQSGGMPSIDTDHPVDAGTASDENPVPEPDPDPASLNWAKEKSLSDYPLVIDGDKE